MRARELIKKYPTLWAQMEASVWYDMKDNGGFENVAPNHKRRVAFNAAFEAVYRLNAELKKMRALHATKSRCIKKKEK